MSKKLEDLCKLAHSISNRMAVVDHIVKIYAKQLPEHRLTHIGLEAIQQSKKELTELKNELLRMSRSGQENKNVHPAEVISLKEWKEKLIEAKAKLSEMSVFAIDIQASELPDKGVYVNVEDINEEIGLYFEEVAMTGATHLGIKLSVNDKTLRLSLSDDGDGSLDAHSENIKKLKNSLSNKDIQVNVRSIAEVGSNLTLDIKLAS